MKVTHIARLKRIEETSGSLEIEIFEYLLTYGGNYSTVRVLGNDIVLVQIEDNWINLSSDLFTDLRDIKPVVEIPETPFWAAQEDSIFKLIENDDGFKVFMNGKGFLRRIDAQEIRELLTDGTWKICDDPKVEMRAWNDDELLEFLYSDGWITSSKWNCDCKVADIFQDEKKVRFSDQSTRSFSQIINNYTDRHGNKFEKEVER